MNSVKMATRGLLLASVAVLGMTHSASALLLDGASETLQFSLQNSKTSPTALTTLTTSTVLYGNGNGSATGDLGSSNVSYPASSLNGQALLSPVFTFGIYSFVITSFDNAPVISTGQAGSVGHRYITYGITASGTGIVYDNTGGATGGLTGTDATEYSFSESSSTNSKQTALTLQFVLTSNDTAPTADELHAIAEPGSFAVLGLGLLGMGYVARRRNMI